MKTLIFKSVFTLSTGTLVTSLPTFNNSTNDLRAVRNCDQKLLPTLWDPNAQWFCKGNSCGIACPGNIQHKNLYWCNHKNNWEKSTSDFENVRSVSCEIFSNLPNEKDKEDESYVPPVCALRM